MLKCLRLGLFMIGLLSGTAALGEEVLKIGYLLPQKSQIGAGALAFAKEVALRTNGKYRIEQYPSSELGGELEMVQGVQAGEIDIAFITDPPFTILAPELGIFNIPYLFPDARRACEALDGPAGQEYLVKISGLGVQALAWGENGMRHLTNSKRPIREPRDLEGIRIRLPQSPLMVEAAQTLGMRAEQLAFPALYSALETHRFDAQENPIATIISARFDKVQKYLSMTGHIYSWAVFIMSKEAWQELTPEEKIAFMEAARIGGVASRKFAQDAEKQGLDTLRASGMQVSTNIDREAFAAALKPANAKFAERFGAQQIERIRNSH
jgi:TRAP-type transport system periplasmic protein